jgi:hypothetical protein
VGWNTGCDTITNRSSSTFNVIDLENLGLGTLILAPVAAGAPFNVSCFKGTIFPWCANSSDINSKAFFFIRDGLGAFFMFQRGANTIAFTPFGPPGSPSFPGTSLISAQSRVDVIINANGTPSAVTSRGPC